MPVNYNDRYKVRREDWEAAERWTHDATWHLGFLYEKKISSITIYSSDELWIGGKETEMGWKEDMELNPDVVTLEFVLGDTWRPEPYLQRISFDVGRVDLPVSSQVDWKVSDGDPPASLEELIERVPELSERARQFPAFFELYTGIYDRIFPQVEREHVYTDVGPYEEGRKLPATHLKKEIWRTDLLTALQGLRFPPMEVEGEGAKVRVVWEPQGHTNYMIWFNLNSGEDPKLCAYCDPTYSGSTTGWLSTRLLKNEAALAKLPYTIEQWVVEDLRGKAHAGPDYRQWRQNIRELLRHRIPRELEEAWGALRRQLVHVEREDIHTDTGAYGESIRVRDESLIRKLQETGEEEERYYGIATGDGNSGISHSFPEYIVKTNNPWDLAKLAAHAQFKDDPAIQEWVAHNMEIDGDSEYGISVVFPESIEQQEAREEEFERRRAAAEEAGEEFDPESDYDDWGGDTSWFMVDVFPMEASEVDRLSCEVYDDTDHPDWMDSLFPLVQPEDVHTDVGSYEESLTAKEADFRLLKTREEIERLRPGDRVYLIINPGKEIEEFFSAKVINVLPGEGMVKIYVDDPRCDWGHAEDRTRVYSANTYLYAEDVPVEREEIHTDTGSYEEAFLRHLPEQFRLKG
jgi:hypothetical protein